MQKILEFSHHKSTNLIFLMKSIQKKSNKVNFFKENIWPKKVILNLETKYINLILKITEPFSGMLLSSNLLIKVNGKENSKKYNFKIMMIKTHSIKSQTQNFNNKVNNNSI